MLERAWSVDILINAVSGWGSVTIGISSLREGLRLGTTGSDGLRPSSSWGSAGCFGGGRRDADPPRGCRPYR